ncbi:MAG: hypothetical protein WEA56_07875 [Balneolaceae bacterium]
MESKKEITGDDDYAVNAVIGDRSYIHYYGEKPGENVPDKIRIQTHLMYVEEVLRKRSTDHLSEEQKENRTVYMDLLRDYYLKGEFPVNDGHSDPRRPTFIDGNGNICAVGYLLEQTEGRNTAEAINAKYKHAFIYEIESPVFDEWMQKSGFTIDELAMIQPAYEPEPDQKVNRNEIDLSYGIGSAFLMATNTLYMVNKSDDPKIFTSPDTNHWFGLAAGTSSVLLGLLNLDNSSTYFDNPFYPDTPNCAGNCVYQEVTETNRARTALSVANVGVGLISILRSGYHLVFKREVKQASKQIKLSTVESGYMQAAQAVPWVRVQVNF